MTRPRTHPVPPRKDPEPEEAGRKEPDPNPRTRKPIAPDTAQNGLLLIGAFKLLKGLLLFSVGVGLLKLLDKDVSEVVEHWVEVLRVDPDNRFIHKLLVKLWSVDDHKLKELSAGTFFYASLTLTEGTGLLLRKRWAEYFTIIVTASFIPLEIYELARKFTPARVLVLGINVLILVYLIVHVRREFRGSRPT